MPQRFGPFVLNFDMVEPADAAGEAINDVTSAVASYRDAHDDDADPLSVRVDLAVSVDEGQVGDIDAGDLRSTLATQILNAAEAYPELDLTIGDAPQLSADESEDIAGNSGSITAWYVVTIG